MITQTEISKKAETDYSKAFAMLEEKVLAVLQTYSNVERGSGHFSQITTALYEHAKKLVLEFLHLSSKEYVVIFCSPMAGEKLKQTIAAKNYYYLSSHDLGLPIGLRVLVVKKKDLPKGIPFQMGGGTVKLVSSKSLVLADVPERFEAGTPPVVNAITFAVALRIVGKFKSNPFQFNDELKETSAIDAILHVEQWVDLYGTELLSELQKTIIGRKTIVPVEGGEQRFINFDNAASTPAFLPVWNAACKAWRQPVSAQKNIVTEVKNICSGFFHAPQDSYDVVFCTNTTEAINIVARSMDNKDEAHIEPVVLNTRLEHHSNELPWRFLRKTKHIRLEVDNYGFINLQQLERLLREYNENHLHGRQRIRMVAVNGASNVLGSYNDLRSIATIAHKYKAQILVDGAQLVAHRRLDLLNDGIDFLAFSGHKMYAPFGSGALIARKGLLSYNKKTLDEIKASGEENIVGIAAIGKSMDLLQRTGMDNIRDEEQELTRYALQAMSGMKGVKLFGIKDVHDIRFADKGAIITFRVKGVPHNLVAKELAEIGGIGVRTGCFCAHLIVKQLMSITLLRGKVAELFLKLLPTVDTGTLPGVVRISFGLGNDANNIDQFVQTMQRITSTKRNYFQRFTAYMQNGTIILPETETEKQIKEFINLSVDRIFRL